MNSKNSRIKFNQENIKKKKKISENYLEIMKTLFQSNVQIYNRKNY